MAADLRMMTDRQLAEVLGLSRRTIWRLTATVPDFPRPIKLCEGTTRWRAREVEQWISRRAGEGGGSS